MVDLLKKEIDYKAKFCVQMQIIKIADRLLPWTAILMQRKTILQTRLITYREIYAIILQNITYAMEVSKSTWYY